MPNLPPLLSDPRLEWWWTELTRSQLWPTSSTTSPCWPVRVRIPLWQLSLMPLWNSTPKMSFVIRILAWQPEQPCLNIWGVPCVDPGFHGPNLWNIIGFVLGSCGNVYTHNFFVFHHVFVTAWQHGQLCGEWFTCWETCAPAQKNIVDMRRGGDGKPESA